MKKIDIGYYIASISLGIFLAISIMISNPNLSIFDFTYHLAWFMLLFIVFMLVSTIIHELGHLLFGLLMGYSFISFSLYPFSLIKQESGYKISKLSVSGIAGQCLMKPKADVFTLNKTVIYNLGGGLLNIIASLITIALLFIYPLVNYPLLIVRLFYLSGFTMAFSNLIPLKVNGVANDGYNIKMLLNDKNSLKAINDSLTIYATIVGGGQYQDLNADYYYTNDTFDFNNSLLIMLLAYKINYLIELKDYTQAYKYIEKTLANFDDLLPHYKIILFKEKLFFDILGNNTINEVDKNSELFEKIIKSEDIDSLRVRLVYNYFILNDQKLAKKTLDKYNTLLSKSLYKADKIIGQQLLDLILEKTAININEI